MVGAGNTAAERGRGTGGHGFGGGKGRFGGAGQWAGIFVMRWDILGVHVRLGYCGIELELLR